MATRTNKTSTKKTGNGKRVEPKAVEAKAAEPKKTARKPAPKKAASSKSSPALTPQERWEMISTAAYFLAEQDGFSGDPASYWLAAEHMVRSHE